MRQVQEKNACSQATKANILKDEKETTKTNTVMIWQRRFWDHHCKQGFQGWMWQRTTVEN